MLNHVYIEFGGGLGDIFHQLYTAPGYRHLETLGPGRTAHVGLVTHNPYAIELFRWHPRIEFITQLTDYGYWLCSEDAQHRARHAIPPISPLPPSRDPVRFYPAPTETINGLSRVVAVAASAGLLDRTFPQETLDLVVERLLLEGYGVMLLGRSFDRHGRHEIRPRADLLRHCEDRIDRLSVPATAQVLEHCAGLVTAHSALNILAWHLRKPQLLLYPQSVYDRHLTHRDQWAFGIDYPETAHGLFGSQLAPLLDQFTLYVNRLQATH